MASKTSFPHLFKQKMRNSCRNGSSWVCVNLSCRSLYGLALVGDLLLHPTDAADGLYVLHAWNAPLPAVTGQAKGGCGVTALLTWTRRSCRMGVRPHWGSMWWAGDIKQEFLATVPLPSSIVIQPLWENVGSLAWWLTTLFCFPPRALNSSCLTWRILVSTSLWWLASCWWSSSRWAGSTPSCSMLRIYLNRHILR